MTRRLLLGLIVGATLSGCMSAELARVRRDVGHAAPEARLANRSAPHLGRLPLALARAFVDGDTRDLLRPVRGVAIGRYAARGPLRADALDLGPTEARLLARGWEPVVVVRDSAETTQIYARMRGDVLRDLLVVSLDADGLSLVRVLGQIDGDALARLTGTRGRAVAIPGVRVSQAR